MKIIKPLRLMVMPRPYRWRNGKYLAVTVAALFKDAAGEVSILPEHTLVNDVLPDLDSDGVLDFMMPKPNPEYLVSGYAFTNHQHDKTKCMVSVRVGEKRKDGLVFGDRCWIDGRMSPAQPFDSMSLGWSNSFGGPNYPDNPLGTGIEERERGGFSAVWLPSLESPTDRIHSPNQHVMPFNFGQIYVDWMHRMSKIGSCDEVWMQEVGTGFFDDLDPSIFNSAADDQIWQNRDALSMDEDFEIWNMHPETQCWSGTLPAVEARSFIRWRNSESDSIEEVPMRPTTVWFVPHQCSYIVLFHGYIPIQEDDGFDVVAVMGALERRGEPRTLQHYTDIFNTRSDFQQAALHALRDEELMPADMLAPWFESMSLEQHPMLAKLGEQLARHNDASSTQELIGPIKPLTLNDLPAIAERSMVMHEAVMQQSKASAKKDLEIFEKESEESASKEEKQLFRKLADSLDASHDDDEIKIPISGPPDMTSLVNTVKKLDKRRDMRRAFVKASEGERGGAARQMYDFSKTALKKSYLYSVQYQEEAEKIEAGKAVAVRERVLWKHRLNRRLTDMDLTGADLSDMDLSGADFSRSWLEKANFSNTNLAGARFHETVLARGQFTGTNLEGASLQDANISEAQFERVSLKGASLVNLVCEKKTTFNQCVFDESTFDGFSAEQTHFNNCTLTGVKMDGMTFEKGSFVSCGFGAAKLDRVTFMGVKIEDICFSDALIVNSAFIDMAIDKLRMTDSVLIQTLCAQDVTFRESALEQSVFKRCMFNEVVFSAVSFEMSAFEQCNFLLADLQKCNLRRIATPQSIFSRANLDMADLSGSNLMHGNFSKATFIGTNLSGCNLFEADMSETLLDKTTLTAGALIERTRLAPFREDSTRLRRQ